MPYSTCHQRFHVDPHASPQDAPCARPTDQARAATQEESPPENSSRRPDCPAGSGSACVQASRTPHDSAHQAEYVAPPCAHALGHSVDQPFAYQPRSFRRHIPRSQPRPTCSHNQTRTGRMTPQRCGNQIHLIGQNLGSNHTHSSGLEQLADRRPGEVNLLPPRAAVAHREHNSTNIGRKALSHASQSTGFAHSFINFRSITSTP